MYLKVSPRSDGRAYLSIAQNFRDGKRSRTKTIESLGYLDELEKLYGDPIAHFKEVVAQREAERKAEIAPVSLRIDPAKKLAGEALRKNLGFSALSSVYHELGLKGFFTRLGNKSKAAYNLNAVVKLLCYQRILDPGSKRRAHRSKEGYFEKFEFSEDDIYRALDLLADCNRDLQLYLHRKVAGLYGRGSELFYYDVTNYYFETEASDDLRKKGVCKEHRPDPIVQMGLLIDSAGLPVSWDLFAGNTSDCKTWLPVISNVKRNYDVGRVIVVADKGINTSDNCAYALIKGDGYVFSKSIRKSDEELKSWCLNTVGYKKYNDERFMKSRIAWRNLYIEGPDGKKKEVPVEERQVAVFSPKYARRAARKREDALAKARNFITDPASYNRAISYGAAKYIKGLKVDKSTGEILECATHLTLDEERVASEALYDGFYLIVSSELDRSAADIAGMYGGLYKIEESFKITKSYLKARPVFVWTDAHIRAHFLICFIALLIVRILEFKTDHKHSVEAMITALQNASGTHIESNWWVFDYRDEALDTIGQACDIDFSRKYLRLADIKTIVGDTKK